MSAHLLDGRTRAKELRAQFKEEIAVEAESAGSALPTLAAVQIGSDASASGYARAIERTCTGVGAGFRHETLPAESTQAEAEALLAALNQNSEVHGIMVLEPLPDHIDGDRLSAALHPQKDVDGVHPLNIGRLVAQRPPYVVPATPAGAMQLLDDAGISLRGKHAVIVGRSDIVGKPMAMLLLHRHCTVTIAHSRTADLPAVTRTADILCVAVGRPEMVNGDWVKPGAVVVDFGTTYTDDGLKGDCEQESVAAVAGHMTPVPGGTGPMTNAMLMQNLLTAYRALARQLHRGLRIKSVPS